MEEEKICLAHWYFAVRKEKNDYSCPLGKIICCQHCPQKDRDYCLRNNSGCLPILKWREPAEKCKVYGLKKSDILLLEPFKDLPYLDLREIVIKKKLEEAFNPSYRTLDGRKILEKI